MTQMHTDIESSMNELHLGEEGNNVNATADVDFLSDDTKKEADDKLEWLNAVKSGKIDYIKQLILLSAQVGWKDEQKSIALYLMAWLKRTDAVSLFDHGTYIETKNTTSEAALCMAAVCKVRKIFSLLLRCGASNDTQNKDLDTALHKAAEYGQMEVVQLLLSCGATVDIKSRVSNTPLHLAAANGHKEIAELLIKHGSEIDAKNKDSFTPIHEAAKGGHKEVVHVLLNGGATVDAKQCEGDTSLYFAASRGYNDVLHLLLKDGADVNARNEYQETALHGAVMNGDTETVKILLKYGAAVDAKDKESNTPLHKAAASIFCFEVVPTLIQHGADVHAKNESLDTALHIAACYGNDVVEEILLGYGAAIGAKNKQLRTALHQAAANEYGQIGWQLLFKCANVDEHASNIDNIEALDENGQTPFMLAANASERVKLSQLIEVGANIDAADFNSMTALHWAAKDENEKVLEWLLQRHIKIEATTKGGNTALHLAAQHNKPKSVTILLKYGAHADAHNQDDKTPTQLAISNGHIEIAYQLIVESGTVQMSENNYLSLAYLAVDAGKVDLVQKALGMNSNAEDITCHKNAVLRRAVQLVQVDVALHLLDIGANTEECNEDGTTLLFLVGKYPELVSKFIHSGANMEARNELDGNIKVLHHFASLGQIEAIRIMIHCGCNVHSTDNAGNTALHYAAENGHCEVAALLIEHGIDVNAKNDKGETTLHIAIAKGGIDIASLLIECGIDLEAKDYVTGSTALHLAAHSNLIKESALLIECGANVNAEDNSLRFPLHFAACNFNPHLVGLLLNNGASVDSSSHDGNPIECAILTADERPDFPQDCDMLAVTKLFVQAGIDVTDLPMSSKLIRRYPTLVHAFGMSIYNFMFFGERVDLSPVMADKRKKETEQDNCVLKEYIPNAPNRCHATNSNERRLINIKHKYGYGFPSSRYLQLDYLPKDSDTDSQVIRAGRAQFAKSLKLFDAISIDDGAVNVIQHLLDCLEAKLFISEKFFLLESDNGVNINPPKWASQFDMLKGIVREPGLLIVQIPTKNTSLSISHWHNSDHPYLRFADAVYVCRKSSTHHDQEAFSDVLGGSEQCLATDLHAILIESLSILSIAGGDGLVEKLVIDILHANRSRFHQNSLSDPDEVPDNWNIGNRRQCPCNAVSGHRPLSPVAAAKAVGMNIWHRRHKHFVNRVWDLQKDVLIEHVDVREVIFITHTWKEHEIQYREVMATLSEYFTVSKMSEKLRRIRDALLQHTRYVWVDTICIDKSNLSELDEAIRSMYKWYANCAAVILEFGTPLTEWCQRGWCLQEAAAAGILCGMSKGPRLTTIQNLATAQHQSLCSLDLHLYYRPGNAAEILARMDVRKTSRDEDMAYALTGIFSIHLTLAYGEGIKSRQRLLHELAIQKGDLSFLSFQSAPPMFTNYLPVISQTKMPIAECTNASTSITVSHFGICLEVQLIKGQGIMQILQNLIRWQGLKFTKGRYLGIDHLIKAARLPDNRTSPSVELAIVRDIRSLILVKTHDTDWQASAKHPIKLCYRLQCCQIEENEFERLFDETDVEFERIWLGDKPSGTRSNTAQSWRMRRREGKLNKHVEVPSL